MSLSFPENFVWGVAAASYQIEGAAALDGKGPSTWDAFCHKPGAIWRAQNAEVACDHYHRYQEDVNLMAELGLEAYRLSVSWPRVLPEGTGAVNAAGLAFYDRLVDALLEKNIQPWITLFHWDYPQALFHRGGWLNRDSANWFADYARVLTDKLSDRVSNWITHNEFQCFTGLGHLDGVNAPGLKLDFPELLLVIHNALRAHGLAVQAIRQNCKKPANIGAAPAGVIGVPASDRPEDIQAARKFTNSVSCEHYWNNALYSDPMILGHYPEDALALFGHKMPKTAASDMKTICQPLDFYGINIYHGEIVEGDGAGGFKHSPVPVGVPMTTMMDWRVVPSALYWGPKFFYERYKLPIVVTENGMANCDWVHLDGKVHDPQRSDFLARYLSEYRRAGRDGVDIRGYFLWTFMDNFEWSFGYRQRFGLVHVDFNTGRRTPKDSAFWYRDTIRAHGANLPERVAPY